MGRRCTVAYGGWSHAFHHSLDGEPATIPGLAAGFEFLTFELPHFIMERRMMLGIKELAERRHQHLASAR